MKTVALTACVLAFAASTQASITASFSDHTVVNTTYFTGQPFQTGEKTAVDQWTGIAGNGWTDSWKVQTGGSNQREARVINGGLPLTPGDNQYLTVRHLEENSTNTRFMAIYRTYDSFGDVDMTQASVTEFYYRVDVSSSFAGGGATYIDIRDGGNFFNNSGTTWNIRTSNGTTKRWTIGDGNGTRGSTRLDTRMVINDGDIYHFSILSDPTTNTWDIVITNTTTGDVYDNQLDTNPDANTLGFIDNTNSLGGRIQFGSQVRGVERFDNQGNLIDDSVRSALNISLDNISINAVPTPGTIGLIGVAGIAAVRRRR